MLDLVDRRSRRRVGLICACQSGPLLRVERGEQLVYFAICAAVCASARRRVALLLGLRVQSRRVLFRGWPRPLLRRGERGDDLRVVRGEHRQRVELVEVARAAVAGQQRAGRAERAALVLRRPRCGELALRAGQRRAAAPGRPRRPWRQPSASPGRRCAPGCTSRRAGRSSGPARRAAAAPSRSSVRRAGSAPAWPPATLGTMTAGADEASCDDSAVRTRCESRIRHCWRNSFFLVRLPS